MTNRAPRFRHRATPFRYSRRMKHSSTLLLAAALAGCASLPGQTPMGTRPSYLQAVTADVPNGRNSRARRRVRPDDRSRPGDFLETQNKILKPAENQLQLT